MVLVPEAANGYLLPMISVVIPTLNAENGLARTLEPLVSAAVAGLVREVIVVDGGSQDKTLEIADDAGAKILHAEQGRGNQLASGAEVARSEWLLFLHADTVLTDQWQDEADKVLSAGKEQAAVFRFALDDDSVRARLMEHLVRLRCATLSLPYGDQGLLISRSLYDSIGGFNTLPLMEDVDIVRRIGRRNMTLLRSRAITSAARYQKYGYIIRATRNLVCLSLYFCGVPPHTIRKLYG